jgi:hypothetical protein
MLRPRVWFSWLILSGWSPATFAQECVGGAPLRAWDVAVSGDGALTEVVRRGDVGLTVRPFGPVVLRGALGRTSYRDGSPSNQRKALAILVPLGLHQRYAAQACAEVGTQSATYGDAKFRLRHLAASAGAGRLVAVGNVLALGPWVSLAYVSSRFRYPSGFPTVPPAEERFLRGTIGLAVSGFGRATARAYYERSIFYSPPAGRTRSETIASDPTIGMSLAVRLPRP